MTQTSRPDRQTVTLAEYGEAPVELTPPQTLAFRRLAGNRVSLLPGDAPNGWRIKASSYVGTLVTPDVQVLIRPKVTTANLFYLLESGGKALSLGAEVFDYDSTGDLIPSFATFYARHLELALAAGIPREYREEEERLPTIRGRVNVPAQRRLAGLALPVECRFDDYTGDTQLTRILRAAATRLLRLPGVTVTTREALQQASTRLSEASGLLPEDLRAGTRFTRLNRHCQPAERLARLVLGGSTLLDADGTAGAAVFLVDMNLVFESFVESRLTRYLTGRLRVRPQKRDRLDLAGLVRIKPDLVFEDDHRETVYIADTKYKVTADGLGREEDYYQLLAYLAAFNQDEGLLIYCQHDGTAPAGEVVVRNLHKRLRTWAIRLDRSPQHIEQELAVLADHIVKRALKDPATSSNNAGTSKTLAQHA
jgi:5-methylcytosine-specific restriction enzyme subunit McrC